jgi:ubiquitin-like modifier-activating enzyme ATG7
MSSLSSSSSSKSTPVKFLPFSSTIESAFWVQYCHLKLETIRLKEDPIPIRASYYSPGTNTATITTTTGNNNNHQSNRLQLQESSLLKDSEFHVPNDKVACQGTLIGYNTLEAFQKVDKNTILRDIFVPQLLSYGHKGNDTTDISKSHTTTTTIATTSSSSSIDDESKIVTTTTNARPHPPLTMIEALTSFVLLTFADLKQHKVLYWFGFPVFLTKKPIVATQVFDGTIMTRTSSVVINWDSLAKDLQSCRIQHDKMPPYIVYSKVTNTWVALDSNSNKHDWNNDDDDDDDDDDFVFGFVDPTTTTAGDGGGSTILPTMGWPMRNLVAYLSMHLGLGGKEVTILSLRPGSRGFRRIDLKMENISNEPPSPSGSSLAEQSILLKVTIPPAEDYDFTVGADSGDADLTPTTIPATERQYKVVGWELNARQKPGPRWVNLRPLLDQNHLAIQAADLNLKLMKWRMIPDLNIDMLQSTKVLLIGAGTLGCSVARTLLGWGVRNFKFVDYGTVSYSNPVRQNLFTLDDCHFNNGQGRPKAEAAAAALKTIAADVNSEGIMLSIPMPGHSSETEESLKESVENLDALVQEADVIFLLTDTRESRWLPTIMAAAHDKILINAALGLDSWLVMRHGGGDNDTDSPSSRLGCYFCNDVVAPENSTKNRTLDQQCTVTRPGLAPIASSMAVEMLVSLLHHPKKQRAEAPAHMTNYSPTVSASKTDPSESSPLGVIPHQIRGSLVTYTMMAPTVPAFKFCTACSVPTIEAYRDNKLGLVSRVCASLDGTFLEDLSGLTAFRAEAAEKLAEMEEDWDDDDD